MSKKKGGVLGSVSQTLFGDGGAAAAQRAAMMQQAEFQRAYAQYEGDVNTTTTSGLLALDKDIANQERNLGRQEQLIAQIDPTIIEASQQALKLLKGEQSSTLAPMERQRAQQRQGVLNSLRERLGPGAETSTAGMQALSRFDSETNNLLAGQQQSALHGLGGIAGQFNSIRPDMLREISGLSGFGQAKTGLGFQRANGLFNARQGLVQNAGASETGAVLRGQQNAAFGQTALTAAGAYLTGGISLLAKKDEPAATTAAPATARVP